ncbi:hypothetical protein [Nocardia sp. CA-135398]|uniref:hypothetical protein n=1 Tax=Nocardia sp. CA-135398 TaxID=3239977 RepID=UPI003D998862
MEIPPEVADFLDCCGVRYPDIDEGDVRGLALKVRTFAASTRDPDAPEPGDALAAYQRMAAAWAGSDDDQQAELDRVCATIAKALDAVAYVMTVTKAVVLTELAALATTYAAMTATPAARITGPLVTAAARRLCTQMELALIGYLVIEVIGRAVEPLERGVDKLFSGAVSINMSSAEPAPESQLSGAASAQPQLTGAAQVRQQTPAATSAEPPMPAVAAEPGTPAVTSGEAQLPAAPRQPGFTPAERQEPDAVLGERRRSGVTSAESRTPVAALRESQSSRVAAGDPQHPGVAHAEGQEPAVALGESRMSGVASTVARNPDAVLGESPKSGGATAGGQEQGAALGEPKKLGMTPEQSQKSGGALREPRMPRVPSAEPLTSGVTPAEPRTPGMTPAESDMPSVPPAESQILSVSSADDAGITGAAQSGRVGPRMQPGLGPSRSRGFVTPWAHAVRASAQRAAFSKGVPSKAFQTVDRRATTARKPRETPWSKLARQSEPTSSEMAVTVPTVRRRDDGGR